jgi:signal transduction histidine kinase
MLMPDRVRYRYRLDGIDSDWIEAGARREAEYSDLPRGAYTFRVMAANNDGVWSRTEASLGFVMLPRLWQAWWFRTLAVLGLFGLAWASYRRRVSQLVRAQAEQEKFTRRLIERQEQERKRIASELHDSLGQSLVIIKNRARQAQESVHSPEETLEQLVEITDSATEALAEVRQIAYDLRPFQIDRLGLTKAIDGLVRNVADASGLKISARLEGIDGVLPPGDEIGFYRVVQEALGNVVKHAQATEAEVTIRREAALVHLEIRDDGRGFVPGLGRSDAGKGGFGLIGMAERAKILGAALEIRSAPGHGTTIEVRVRRTTHGN